MFGIFFKRDQVYSLVRIDTHLYNETHINTLENGRCLVWLHDMRKTDLSDQQYDDNITCRT